jgi:excinuclease ABC subunit C
METRILIREKLKNLSLTPGCYLWKSISGEVLYVGKAINLASRVRSYLQKNHPDPKTRALALEIHDLDWIATTTEMEALILEANLIKKYSPKYNIQLKDDKRYPYICVSLSEPYPMVFLTRRKRQSKDRFFGPYTDVKTARETLNLIQKIFPVRKTRLNLPLAKPQRPCLNFHMHRCLGPCQGNVTEETYHEIIKEIIQFLEGKKDNLVQFLKSKMLDHSERMEFELASKFRDRQIIIEKFRERQSIVSQDGGDEDILGLARRDEYAEAILLEVRGGRLEGKKAFPLIHTKDSEDHEIIYSFLREYYMRAEFYPKTIVIPVPVKKEWSILIDWMNQKIGFKPKLISPGLGQKKSLLKLAEKNAQISLTERILATKLRDQTKALQEIQEQFHLKTLPRWIECYDISHIQGFEPVGSGVSFLEGKPNKSGYRHYKIRSYKGINDPGMMHEVLGRRLQKIANGEEGIPDLIIIDGGPTQLNRACEVAKALDLGEIPMVGLAKKREEIYYPGEIHPYTFPINSPMMKLLRSIRDEAHRFGITYHRQRRNKKTLETILDTIPDIGLKRRKALLHYFRDKKKVEDASLDELQSVEGIGPALAQKIKEGIQKSKITQTSSD